MDIWIEHSPHRHKFVKKRIYELNPLPKIKELNSFPNENLIRLAITKNKLRPSEEKKVKGQLNDIKYVKSVSISERQEEDLKKHDKGIKNTTDKP